MADPEVKSIFDTPLDEAEEARLDAQAEAEIDAVVARAYGLTDDDLVVVLDDFNEQAVTPAHRALIFECFSVLSR